MFVLSKVDRPRDLVRSSVPVIDTCKGCGPGPRLWVRSGSQSPIRLAVDHALETGHEIKCRADHGRRQTPLAAAGGVG